MLVAVTQCIIFQDKTVSDIQKIFGWIHYLYLGRSLGNLGRPENAKPLCGWQLGIVVGRLIVCKKGDCLTRSVALLVTKRKKWLNTFTLLTSSQGSIGMLFYSLLTW